MFKKKWGNICNRVQLISTFLDLWLPVIFFMENGKIQVALSQPHQPSVKLILIHYTQPNGHLPWKVTHESFRKTSLLIYFHHSIYLDVSNPCPL